MTKHIKIDCHFVQEKVPLRDIIIKFINFEDQLVDMLTESLKGFRVDDICNKLGSYDIYVPT